MEENKILNAENASIEEVLVEENLSIEGPEVDDNLSLEDMSDDEILSLEEHEDLTDEQKALLRKILDERKNKVQK